MRGDQRQCRGRFVELAALDPDCTVLDRVDAADPVCARARVELGDQLGQCELLAVERDRQTRLERDHDLAGCRRGERGGGDCERLLGRRDPRVLEHARFDRAAEEVVVDRVGRLLLRLDRDPARFRISDFLVARPHAVAQRRDHAHARVARLERELEAELVVPLAGAAVHDRLGPELERDLRDRVGDHGTRERGDERIHALVQRVRLQGSRDLLVGEHVLAVEQDDVVGPGKVAALRRRPEIRILADVHEHGDDLVEAVVLLQPCDRAARVQPARVGEHRGSGHAAPSINPSVSSSRSATGV